VPREIVVVAFQQRGLVILHKVYFSLDLQSLPRPEAAEPEVAVQAANHALEQLLIGFERRGKDHRAVAAEAADQPVAWHVGVQRAWVDIGGWHVRPGPDLPGNVECLGCPVLCRHHCAFAVKIDETLFNVGIFIGVGVPAGACEFAHTNARLCPVRHGALFGGVVRGERKINLVMRGGDDVFDRHAVIHVAVQTEQRAVRAAGDQARLVADDGVSAPVGCL